jgi:two-component system sensor histidine kinase KdpD
MTRSNWSADELRTLLSSVSHDLRTPLSVITGRASVLRATAAESQQRELDTIIQEAQRLSRTLENLVAVIAVEQPQFREWVPAEELAGAVLARLEPVLTGRTVAVDIPDNLLVHVDPVLAELLLANLLDAAARHAPAGTPLELRARRERRSVIIEVADRGTDTPPKPRDLEHTSADQLGLAACRRIAASYGGAVELSQRPGGGTLFHVNLPDGEPLPDLADEPKDVG